MRSTPPSRPRSGSRSRPHRARQQLIEAVAHVVDDAQADDSSGHLLIHVIDDPPEVVLGTRALSREVHPFTALAGFTAPDEWVAFGLRVHGRAHHLDAATPPEPTVTTYLMHRHGEESSLLRRGDRVDELDAPAVGTLPDACRRVLGRATAPPPRTTGHLWTVAWLDAILAAWSGAVGHRKARMSWSDLALLHPAARVVSDHDLLDLPDTARFVEAGRAFTAAWPWARLRAEPAALPLPDGDLPPDVTAWMDDGFYARWALGAFPSATDLAHDLCQLLPHSLTVTLVEAIEGLLA